jgi:hypothetical protein
VIRPKSSREARTLGWIASAIGGLAACLLGVITLCVPAIRWPANTVETLSISITSPLSSDSDSVLSIEISLVASAVPLVMLVEVNVINEMYEHVKPILSAAGLALLEYVLSVIISLSLT